MSDAVAARWEQYNESGRRAFGQGRMAEAEEAFRAAVREGEQIGGESPQLAASLNALGQIRFQAKDLATAESCFVRALAIREKSFGAEAHALVPTLNNLAAVHDARGDVDRAQALLERSLSIIERQLGATHPEVAVALNNLAKLHFRKREFAKADKLLIRLLEIKRAVSKDHPEVATVLGSLAKLRQAVGKHEQGEQLWRQALAIRERSFSPDDVVIATTLENVADCCAAQQSKLSEAIALRNRAMQIRERSTEKGHPALANARAKLDELLARSGAAPAAPGAQPTTPRLSQELPKPIVSQEVPKYPAGGVARPSSDLPWIQVDHDPVIDPSVADPIGMMGSAPSIPLMRGPENVLSRASMPRVAPVAPNPKPLSAEPTFSELLSPERTPVEPRRPAAPPPSPSYERGTTSRPGPAHRAEPKRAPMRMAANAGREGGTKKALLFALVLALGAVGGWVGYARRASLPFHIPFVNDAAVTAEAPARNENAGSLAAASPVSATVPSVSRVVKDSARAPVVAAAASSPSDSVKRKRPRVADDGLSPRVKVDVSASAISSAIQLDAVTRGIEASTRSEVQTVQKGKIDTKPTTRRP